MALNPCQLPMVSIITPCYNGESYIYRFLDSLLIQDYENVEFIFINDGSTDRTREIFESYRASIEAKGWLVKYIWQENAGQASALNNGLKLFTGKYLLWPDSDDILHANHISRKVDFMEKNKEIGIAYCAFDVVREEDIETVVSTRIPPIGADMFENIMEDKDCMWAPISPIIRSSSFFKVNPARDIPVCCGGQNCQMQMPMVYKQQYGIISETLAKYVIRTASHSRSQHDFIRRQKNLAEIWVKTIELLPCSRIEKTKLQLRVIKRYFLKVLYSYKQKSSRKIFEALLSIKNEGDHKVVRVFRFKILSMRRKQTL